MVDSGHCGTDPANEIGFFTDNKVIIISFGSEMIQMEGKHFLSWRTGFHQLKI